MCHSKLNAIHTCIVQETTKCSDPTPANILDALITQMLKVTPCWQFKERQLQGDQVVPSPGGVVSSDGAAASTSGAASSIDASSFSSLVKTALANIGPILASCVGGVAGAGLLWAALWSYLESLVSVILAAGVFIVTCSTSCCAAVLEHVLNVFTGLWKHDSLDDVASWKTGSFDTVLREYWVTLMSCVSMSGILMVALAGVTAANLLF